MHLKTTKPVHHFNKVKRLYTLRTTGQLVTKANNKNKINRITLSFSTLYVLWQIKIKRSYTL